MKTMQTPFSHLGPIDHVGIAVLSLDESVPFYRDTLKLPLLGIEEVADQGVRTAIFSGPVGRVELLEATHADSPIAKFIAKRGEGMHHVALRVTDLDAELARLEAQGVQLIDRTARIGAGGHRIAFLHPKATGGVLLELCEPHAAET